MYILTPIPFFFFRIIGRRPLRSYVKASCQLSSELAPHFRGDWRYLNGVRHYRSFRKFPIDGGKVAPKDKEGLLSRDISDTVGHFQFVVED